MMRCFIAIDLDEEIKEQLAKLQAELRKKADIKKGDAKWVKPDSIHLTLKFLGEVRDEGVTEVCRMVGDVAGEYDKFILDVGRVGYFGGSSAKVLWVGAGENNDELVKLQGDIDKTLAMAGWREETRRFTGHLTLCRIRNPRAGRILAELSKEYENLELGSMEVESVCVYQSQLTSAGPIYTALSRNQLGK
jgi:2'-5' RNA ligase